MKPAIFSNQLDLERNRLHQIAEEKGITSIEAIEQSTKVDHIINQINQLETIRKMSK
ncbi:MAG TPA: Spo0E family sporulation regulatory protein-aspartic acid phosphatase [Oscillospiraceae bacterium]|nr:Spo0E family sporulation regulatory protein-aspartic acid phosphatase [Oscillospiraceae bacterium]